jgi:hypothetical protein
MAKVRQMAGHVAGLVGMAEDDPENKAMGEAAEKAIEALMSLPKPEAPKKPDGPPKLRRI